MPPNSGLWHHPSAVIAGLDPTIHDESQRSWTYVNLARRRVIMDARVKPGHDAFGCTWLQPKSRWQGREKRTPFPPPHIDSPAPAHTLNTVPRGARFGLRKTL